MKNSHHGTQVSNHLLIQSIRLPSQGSDVSHLRNRKIIDSKVPTGKGYDMICDRCLEGSKLGLITHHTNRISIPQKFEGLPSRELTNMPLIFGIFESMIFPTSLSVGYGKFPGGVSHWLRSVSLASSPLPSSTLAIGTLPRYTKTPGLEKCQLDVFWGEGCVLSLGEMFVEFCWKWLLWIFWGGDFGWIDFLGEFLLKFEIDSQK